MVDIRSFIEDQLLEPLKRYPTVIQDTMLELIIEKLETLYNYTVKFPEIVSPDTNRLDILKAISDQFLFTVRNDADLQEQVDILDNILYVYSRRGSIDTIENMWKYYGGKLPKDVKVVIPSYNLFRYSISRLSGTHKFANDPEETGVGGYYRTGVYEIRLTNSNYPIPDLKKFMLKELVAAGNRIFFTNTLHMESLSGDLDTNPYKYGVLEDTSINLQMLAMRPSSIGAGRGISLSGSSPLNSVRKDSRWSGSMVVFLEVDLMKDLSLCQNNYYNPWDIHILYSRTPETAKYGSITIYKLTEIASEAFLYCTPTTTISYISRHLYNSAGEVIDIPYPGYFILGESLLGEEVI